MFTIEIEVRGAAPVAAKQVAKAADAKADFLAICKIPLCAIVRVWYDGSIMVARHDQNKPGDPILSADIDWGL